MAWHIGEKITGGVLANWRRDVIHGQLELVGPRAIRIELSGNFEGQLDGRGFRFTVTRDNTTRASAVGDISDSEAGLAIANRQSGFGKRMAYRLVRYARDEKPHESPCRNSRLEPCLCLEWWSQQNGRVIAKIRNPTIEFIAGDPSSAFHRKLAADI